MTSGEGRGLAIGERCFLFLQGPSSRLFSRLADHLEAAGARCLRVNLNAGDWLFWRRPGAYNFRGRQASWPAYIREMMREGVTDLVLLGEERFYHKIAVEEAEARGISVFVIEMGHLRPDWITIERRGLASNSLFPNDPAQIMQAAKDLPEPDWTRRFRHSFFQEASADVLYYVPAVVLRFLYPGFRRHGLDHAFKEYGGWILRLLAERRRNREAASVIEKWHNQSNPYFIYPLQLQTDFQLRAHSPFRSQQDAIRFVLRSFTKHSPPEFHLLVKVHPLDPGLFSWTRYVQDVSKAMDVQSRVEIIDGGSLDDILPRSLGMVTVNSTSSLAALQRGRPVKVLGNSIVDIAGLTDQQPLHDFWCHPSPPDSDLLEAFLKLVAASIQVRGTFYASEGMENAAQELAAKLIRHEVNQPNAIVADRPRRHPQKWDVD